MKLIKELIKHHKYRLYVCIDFPLRYFPLRYCELIYDSNKNDLK